jgi:hydrogenase-4 component F
LIIASVGISFALLGILLTYIASASHLGEQAASLDFTSLLSHAATLNPGLLKLAFLFILVGYGTKTGIAPMHTWLPDAHSQAPTPISALLSGALLNCALYGILRFTILTNAVLDASFTATLLQLFGLVSIGLVIPFLLKQDDIKRLLAYSSVEHMGIILLALGIGGKLGRIAAALHLFNHALTKSLLFCVAGEVTERYQTREIHKIRGVMQATPLLGILLFVGALAITGVPPFNIFVSELMVIAAAFAAHQYLVAALALLLLTTVFVCFFPHIATMAFGQGTRESPSSFSEGDLAREPQTEMLVATTIQKPGGAEKIALVLFAIPALALLIGGFWQPWFLQDWLYMIGAAL